MTQTIGGIKRGNPAWVKGMKSPNPKGRPAHGIEREYLDVFYSVVTTTRWGNVCAKAMEQAESGDRYARDWLSRIIVPALERIIIASLNVNVSADLDATQVGELIGMLTGNVDTGDLVDVIEGESQPVNE